MVRADKIVEAYEAAPDPQPDFITLADMLLGGEHQADLDRLIEAHKSRHPTDPNILRYEAEIHLMNKEWDKAVALLRQALEIVEEKRRPAIRYCLVHASTIRLAGVRRTSKLSRTRDI